VGVGEAMALAGLIQQMGQQWPEARFLITTTARTSGDALEKTGLPPRCLHQFAPVDTSNTVARFLDHWQPSLAIWCEMDLWPALIHATAKRHIPHVLVNARLNDAAIAKRRWGRLIYQSLLPGFNRIWAQNETSRKGLLTLGAKPDRVWVSGTVKSMSPPLACDVAQLQTWQTRLQGRCVWLLASSHATEELLALQVHAKLRQSHPDALLIIAPRAPARGSEIQQLSPIGTLRRSISEDAASSQHSVYVADTIGEMGLWYRLAPVAMIGGSWARVGGHNPYEALALGCHVLHGPHIENFSESYADLAEQGLTQERHEVDALAEAIVAQWQSAIPRAPHGSQSYAEAVESLIQLAKSKAT
jgi:3-deoxy-D-manno-octulosonic-acid transferase